MPAKRPRSAPRLASLVATLGIAAAASGSATATPVTSAGNIPFSGTSPGGVNMATGELILVMRPDLVLNGPFPLVFRRYYASMLAREGVAAGHLGPNWLGTYDWGLSVSGSNATVVTDRGAAIHFALIGGTWSLASPTYAQFRLDPAGTMLRFTNPLNRKIYFFDGTSRLLTQILDEHGNTLSLSYSAAGGQLSQVSDGLGRSLSFTYDSAGHLIQASDGTRTVQYAYTGGFLTGVTDAAGRPWTYSYVPPPDPDRGLIGVMEPAGNTPVTQAYDTSGRVISQTDALGGVAMYAYDLPTGDVFTDPLGNPWTYLHDSQSRLVSLVDPMGGPASFSYDPLGRLATASRPMGDLTSFQYDPASGYPSMVSRADGSPINWGYSSHLVGGAPLFDVMSAMYPDGTSETYERDASGNLMNFTDQGGFHWTGTYNARGQVLTWTNPTSGVTTFTYDTQGRLTTGKDNAGNTTSYGYDALGRLGQVTWPDAATRHYAYDNLDGLTSLTDERSKVWGTTFDANERITAETDPLMETTGYVYDGLDRLTQVVDPLGHATVYSYDPAGRIATETDRSGRATTCQYDALSRLTGVADPAGGTDTYGYDTDSRVVSAADPLGHSTGFMYDMLDRVTHVTDPLGTGFDYGYDVMGRLLSATAPLGHAESFHYDSRGYLTSYFNSTSETDFTRSALGEISQVTDPNRNAWTRVYDPQGRMTSSADPLSRATTYEYDALSRPIHIGRPDGTLQQINYDADGRVAGRQWSDGTTVTYSYDDANRLTGSTGASFAYDAAGRMTSSNGLGMTYDAEGRILTETLTPGKMVSYSYDSRGLLSQVTDWLSGMTSFSYDAARRLTGIARPNGTTGTYAYDAAGRPTSAIENFPGPVPLTLSSIAITRDVLGQPTSVDRRQPLMPGGTAPATSGFTYDAASQMNGVSHDALGRTTGDPSRSFQWDGASRLVHYAAGADSPSFAYDGLGHILSSSQGSQTVQMAWNYGHSYPTNDDLQVSLPTPHRGYNVYTPGGLLLHSVDGSSNERRFYHYDEAGNAAYLTNDGGSVVSEYAYGPFGGVSVLGETSGNRFTYGAAEGMMSLGSSGLWTAGSQVYDDRTMRVISRPARHSGRPMQQGNQTAVIVGPGGDEIYTDKHGRVKVQFHWDREGTHDPSSSAWPRQGPGPVNDPGSVMLNPQPFPPGPSSWAQPGPIGEPGSVMLNPQPFPPGPSSWALGSYYSGNDSGDFSGNYSGDNPGSDGDGLSDSWESVGNIDDDCNGQLMPAPESPGSAVEIVPHWPLKPRPALNDPGVLPDPRPGAYGSGGGTGKVHFHDITIEPPGSSSSPSFFRNCLGGAHYREVRFNIRHAGNGSAGSPCTWCVQ